MKRFLLHLLALVMSFMVFVFCFSGCDVETELPEELEAELVSVSIEGENAVGSEESIFLTASPNFSDGFFSEEQNVYYAWKILSGNDYVSLKDLNDGSVMLTGKNSTKENKSVLVQVSVFYGKTTKTSTMAIKVFPKENFSDDSGETEEPVAPGGESGESSEEDKSSGENNKYLKSLSASWNPGTGRIYVSYDGEFVSAETHKLILYYENDKTEVAGKEPMTILGTHFLVSTYIDGVYGKEYDGSKWKLRLVLYDLLDTDCSAPIESVSKNILISSAGVAEIKYVNVDKQYIYSSQKKDVTITVSGENLLQEKDGTYNFFLYLLRRANNSAVIPDYKKLIESKKSNINISEDRKTATVVVDLMDVWKDSTYGELGKSEYGNNYDFFVIGTSRYDKSYEIYSHKLQIFDGFPYITVSASEKSLDNLTEVEKKEALNKAVVEVQCFDGESSLDFMDGVLKLFDENGNEFPEYEMQFPSEYASGIKGTIEMPLPSERGYYKVVLSYSLEDAFTLETKSFTRESEKFEHRYASVDDIKDDSEGFEIDSMEIPVISEDYYGSYAIPVKVKGKNIGRRWMKYSLSGLDIKQYNESDMVKIVSKNEVIIYANAPNTKQDTDVTVTIEIKEGYGEEEPISSTAFLKYVSSDNLFSIGDIILKDGVRISSKDVSNYRVDDNNPPVSVIAGLKYGGSVGIGVGLKKSDPLQWTIKESNGYETLFSGIQTAAAGSSSQLLSTGSAADYEYDGSYAWDYICSEDDSVSTDLPETYYPAFNYALNYGKEQGFTNELLEGWYIPSIREILEYLDYEEKNPELPSGFKKAYVVKKSLEKCLANFSTLSNCWSSSQCINNDLSYKGASSAWLFTKVSASSFYNHVYAKTTACPVLVVREFSIDKIKVE